MVSRRKGGTGKIKQKAKKFGLSLAALILAVLLVGTAVLAPCLVSAEDGGDGSPIRVLSGTRAEGPGEGEPLAPSFASPGGGDILFEQPPYDASDPELRIYWSDVYWRQRLFDDFWGVTGDIGDIHWYGLSLDPYYNNCDPTGMEFQIIFYEDSMGLPGTPVATFSNVSPTITYYDTYYGWVAYRFEVADLGTPVSLTNGWVSIESTYSPSGCVFYWVNSPAGDWYMAYWYFGAMYTYPVDLAFALTGAEAPPPPPPNVKYLHAEGGWMNITDPIGTQWHELWPIFCREYHLSGWEDNGDGVLSYCDQIDMYEKPDGELRPYHVENVTITLLVKPAENHVVDEVFLPLESPLQGAGESMYIELEGGYNATVLTAPNCTYWHEIYPQFCRQYHLTSWNDTNPNGKLDPCDHIFLNPKQYTPERTCPFNEGFSSWLPCGWTQEQTGEWQHWLSNYAGGTSPEACLYYFYISGDYAYLDSKPFDTSGALSLRLEFKSFIDDFCGSGYYYNCRVYTRADGGDSWTDVTPWFNPIMGGVGPGTYSVDISSDIGPGTQVRFEFDSEVGLYFCLNYWCVDDVKICFPGTWWHMEDVATDIVVTPEIPPVGGEAYPVNKASLLAPWIAVGVLLPGGISWYVLRRRRAQS